MKRFGVVGAGLSGAVVARALAEAGRPVLVLEERDHVAGNCHTARDPETGVMVHVYGPHIFHTSEERVWSYVNRFAEMIPYAHRVRAISGGQVYALPIGLMTINQFFRSAMGPDEARAFIASRTTRNDAPANFEEQALALIGAELYAAFFRDYTQKQWGRDPRELPASVMRRLPLRFDYDDRYFAHRHQAMPRDGFTAMVAAMLAHPLIELRASHPFEDVRESLAHVFYTGPLDRYFRYEFGRLAYRTLDFDVIRALGNHQGAAVINFCDNASPYTRMTEHKYLSPWEADSFERTICYGERSRDCRPGDAPFYPLRTAADEPMLRRYVERASFERGVTFLGRLGSYRYIDMDVAISEALSSSDEIVRRLAEGGELPVFPVSPLDAKIKG